MKFLITGITGFAGPHLANLLHFNGHDVFGLVRCSNGRENDIRDIVPDDVFCGIKFLYADLRNARQLASVIRENSFDGVFHLAAQSHPPTSFTDPIGTMEENVIGSSNLIQAISDSQPGCKLMFCSTSEVYGNVGIDGRKIRTTDRIMPANPYGVSKAAIDIYMQERIQNKTIKGFVTRAFSHTGPRRGRNFSISSDAYQLARMMRGKQDNVLKVGNLESVRVVMDVRDTVNAYFLAMTSQNNSVVYNVCGNTPRKMAEFTDKLIQISGLKEVRKEVCPNLYRPIDIQYQNGDSTHLVNDTEWCEEYTTERTLSDLLKYWYDKIV
jgi:nucleoside-diphosphate-sugar epimerase